MQSTEIWKPVPNYEGVYEVSSLGQVRSIDRLDNLGRRYRGVTLKQGTHPDGHKQIALSKDGKVTTRFVHQLVAEAFIGPRVGNLVACHNNGDPADNRVENIRWDTQQNNVHDRRAHGTDTHANKTHCPRGHLLQLPNLIVGLWKNGYRSCLACDRGRALARGRGIPFTKEVADPYYEALMG